MKTFNQIVSSSKVDFSVSLDLDTRILSRIITSDGKGNEICIKVDRGLVLEDGTLLANEDGQVLQVLAAFENLSIVKAANLIELAKLAYHLGNRHVVLEVNDEGYLAYQTDHVLDDMVQKLGGILTHESRKFAPEKGAYAHHHSHDHEHHDHHEHDHHEHHHH